MDWFSWLSKSQIDPSLAYEYGLVFAHNELEEEDIIYFNHEFLQSIGISIAKHRLEILKIARKEKGSSPPSVSRLLVAVEKAKKCLGKYVRRSRRLGCSDEERALVVVPRSIRGGRWRSAMLKRSEKMAVAKPERLLLDDGSPAVVDTAARWPWARMDRVSRPVVYDLRGNEKMDGGDYGYWLSGVEEKEVRWDTLFHDLRPT